jgi:hypothetical protein
MSTANATPNSENESASRLSRPSRRLERYQTRRLDLFSVSARILVVSVRFFRLIPVAVGLLVLSGCGGGVDDGQRSDTEAAAETSRADSDNDDLRFVPATYREGNRVVLPITFPDGTSAELVYPPEFDVASLGVLPYGSGTLHGKSPTRGRSDFVARDFWIRYGDLEHILTRRNDSRPPKLLAQYDGSGQSVGLWDLRSDKLVQHHLGFQFGRWVVLVYDYPGGGAMTDDERAAWAASFSGRETADGFLLLEASSPLRLARAGDHAGPGLSFWEDEPERGFSLYPGKCSPHRDQDQRVHGKLVEWGAGHADWCLSDSMRIHVSGNREFTGALIRALEVRQVVLADG